MFTISMIEDECNPNAFSFIYFYFLFTRPGFKEGQIVLDVVRRGKAVQMRRKNTFMSVKDAEIVERCSGILEVKRE